MTPDIDLSTTHAADVVVVGGGGAGMSAAIAAADSGAEVLLLQKLSQLGGSTTKGVGSLSAADTTLQAKRGIEDTPTAHFDDLEKFVRNATQLGRYSGLDYQGTLAEKDNRALRRLLVENGAKTLDWLCELGCRYAGPYHESPHRVPRLHQIQPDTTAYAAVLGDAMDNRGVEILYQTTAYELIELEETVVGVLAERRGRTNPLVIEARCGVVLATGDYVNDRDLRAEHTTDATSDPINHHNTGDGHQMAAAAGGQLVNMDMQLRTLRFGDPLYTGPIVGEFIKRGAILCDRSGHRFVDEDAERDQLLDSIGNQPGGVAYLVFDDTIAQAFTSWPNEISTLGKEGKPFGYLGDYLETDVLKRASDAANLAREAGFAVDRFEATIADYNDGISDEHLERIDRFGRHETRRTLSTEPLYALGPLYTNVLLTYGGVTVSEQLQVLNEDTTPIEGLYAAGSLAGDVLLLGHGHHHSWIFRSGRLAGKYAAE